MRQFWREIEFDRILDGDDVFFKVRIDVFHHGSEGGRFHDPVGRLRE